MPKAQTNISADTKRSILRHLMFGMLGLLILMNWTVLRPLDYEPFNESMTLFIPKAKKFNNDLAFNILDAYVREQEDGRPDLHLFTKFVQKSTNEILSEIELLKMETKSNRFEERNLQILNKIAFLNDSGIKYFGTILTSAFYYNGYPFDSAKMQEYKELFKEVGLSLPNTKHLCRIASVNSLEVDVLLAEEFWLFQSWWRIHDDGWGFDGFWGWFIPDCNFYCKGNTLKSQVLLVKNLPREKWNFRKKFLIKVESGSVDTIPYNNRFSWSFQAKNLGLNFVHGSINVQYDTVNVTRPFSFSYFVSAPGIAFHLDKANLCYVGVPNPISISVPGYPADKINLKVAGAKVSKIEDGRFEIFFSKITSAKVYAYVEATNEKGRTSTVHSMELKVKDLPVPITNLESFKEGGISLEELKNLKSIKVQSLDSTIAMEYEVISFQVECITHQHKYIEPITVYGAEYSNSHELMSVFNAASVGDRFIFSNIRAKAANAREYEALPVSILLK